MLTQIRLKELLDYDPETGQFTWRVTRSNKVRAGDFAGCIAHGRYQIQIDYSIYYAARLAVLWMTGELPENQVDHINCNPTDNRWDNLRPADDFQNGANRQARKGKKYSDLKGVTFNKRKGRFEAAIRKNYRLIFLGYFDTAEEAHAAYCEAARKHFGDFARFD